MIKKTSTKNPATAKTIFRALLMTFCRLASIAPVGLTILIVVVVSAKTTGTITRKAKVSKMAVIFFILNLVLYNHIYLSRGRIILPDKESKTGDLADNFNNDKSQSQKNYANDGPGESSSGFSYCFFVSPR